ncbi:ABC transporter permease [Cellvibrio zantedeschiae]|uniref:ABC transporter permease n=1 Tax=Cellvibrio zantedeschiae TaxID=1237077 RepID=A0ABQ3B3A0_9GAMM|nr:iron ABC transporter permease [Cellvibrio zantedeschiae]GGY74608.1 ABC transporter permease [Cellvibrio zantedeschiae]
MQKNSFPILISLLAFGVVATFIFSLTMGNASISVVQAIKDLLSHTPSLHQTVVWEIRLPRVLLAILVGATLGLAGAAMQGFLRNPLAEPGILGVSSGAAFGAVLVLYFGLATSVWYLLPVAAILGALVALVLVYLLAGFRSSVLSLILAGVAINAIAGAMIGVALNFAPSLFAMQEIVFWLMGSLANRNIHHVYIAAPFIIVGWVLLLSRYRFLNALSLGEETASTLGFSPLRERNLLLAGLALCVGASVAVSGSIGFVGLVVPHLLRPLVGHTPGRLLIASALGGALLVLGADILVRQLDVARELKLGVVTSLVGGPFFLMLILKTRSRWI